MTQTKLTIAAAVVAATMILPGVARAAPHCAQDTAFVRKAAQAELAEVQLAQLALRKSNTPRVVSFAKRMRDDHSKANAQLTSIANAQSFTLPHGVAPRSLSETDSFQSLNAHAFDSRYLRAQLQAHQAAIALFKALKAEAANGNCRFLVSFAQSTLPTLEQHLFIARRDVAAVDRASDGLRQ